MKKKIALEKHGASLRRAFATFNKAATKTNTRPGVDVVWPAVRKKS